MKKLIILCIASLCLIACESKKESPLYALIYFDARCGAGSQILFDGCKVNKPQGLAVTGYNLQGLANEDSASTDIIFRNTT